MTAWFISVLLQLDIWLDQLYLQYWYNRKMARKGARLKQRLILPSLKENKQNREETRETNYIFKTWFDKVIFKCITLDGRRQLPARRVGHGSNEGSRFKFICLPWEKFVLETETTAAYRHLTHRTGTTDKRKRQYSFAYRPKCTPKSLNGGATSYRSIRYHLIVWSREGRRSV